MTAMQQALLAAAGAGVVTLSGASGPGIFDSDGSNAIALLIVNSDGTTDKEEGGGNVTQINSADDWLRPTSLAPGPHRVRFTLQSGDTPNGGNASGSLGSWLALTSGRSIGYNATSSTLRGTILVEIDDGHGNVLASAEYELEARIV